MAAIQKDYARELKADKKLKGDRALARAITLAESSPRLSALAARPTNGRRPFVIGVAGPGGAGKSTLIDELTSRFLQQPRGRLAILANDPSHPDSHGAILGDPD